MSGASQGGKCPTALSESRRVPKPSSSISTDKPPGSGRPHYNAERAAYSVLRQDSRFPIFRRRTAASSQSAPAGDRFHLIRHHLLHQAHDPTAELWVVDAHECLDER
jgi:hypothetical protein